MQQIIFFSICIGVLQKGKRGLEHIKMSCVLFNHMEMHAFIPENRDLQLTRREKKLL